MKLSEISLISSLLIGVAVGCQTGTAVNRTASRSFEFVYQVNSNAFDRPQNVEIWLPIPSDGAFQVVGEPTIVSSLVSEQLTDSLYGNRLLHLTGAGVSDPIDASITVVVERREQESTGPLPVSRESVERYLAADSLVPITERIAAEADSVAGQIADPFAKARALYLHLFSTMRYDKSGEGWGRGDAIFACDQRRGNCTDIHSLFIAMCRSQQIPAKFVIGFPLPKDQDSGEVGGYHCWAEFYTDEQGWTPVDISEAIKHPELKEYLFGRLDPDRVAFSRGRDIPLRSAEGVRSVNYLIYPLVLVDGREVLGVRHKFSFADSEVAD